MRIRTRPVAVAMVGIMLCWSAYSQTPASRAERELFASVNQSRRAQGLQPLRWNKALAAAARRHAEVMAERGSAQHGFEGEPSLSARVKQAGAHFNWLSENVIQGPSPEFIHAQFMKSPAHRANILDKDMDSIGVGVVERGGQLFAVEDFSQAR
ncbi:MAG: CAP domain-containing protein [Terriglobales bacterium]